MTEKEQIQNQIQELQEKLKELEELSQTKSPVEEAFKDWWGQYPETGTWDGFDEKRWQGFQAGYEFAYAISTAKEVMKKVQEEPKDNEWKSAALRFGEELVSVGPCGYYNFTPEEWFDWAVNTYEKICDDTVKLLKKENLKKHKNEENEFIKKWKKLSKSTMVMV